MHRGLCFNPRQHANSSLRCPRWAPPPRRMNLKEMDERLIRAEMALAHLNARRTSAAWGLSAGWAAAGIHGGLPDTFEYLLDPARPGSTYYNRAIASSGEAFAPQ